MRNPSKEMRNSAVASEKLARRTRDSREGRARLPGRSRQKQIGGSPVLGPRSLAMVSRRLVLILAIGPRGIGLRAAVDDGRRGRQDRDPPRREQGRAGGPRPPHQRCGIDGRTETLRSSSRSLVQYSDDGRGRRPRGRGSAGGGLGRRPRLHVPPAGVRPAGPTRARGRRRDYPGLLPADALDLQGGERGGGQRVRDPGGPRLRPGQQTPILPRWVSGAGYP